MMKHVYLQVVGFENICSKDRETRFIPNENEYISPHSKMFRFGVMSAIWLVLGEIT